ncbi:MAG: MBL fold metallo-hydrolase [Acidobacteriota bacterium]
MADFIKFLGTAGARYVVAKQLRSSAGVFLNLKGKKIILDPGPGTLVRCAASKPKIDVAALDAVILSHLHIDHTNDVNILIDAMTEGGLKKRGVLFAPPECLHGENAIVLNYLRSFLQEIVMLEEDRSYCLGDLSFMTSINLDHNVQTYGMKFDLKSQKLSFIVDTKFFPGLIENFEDSDILVINVVRASTYDRLGIPRTEIPHLSLDDAKKIVLAIKPKKVVLTHFGMTLLKAKPWEMAQRMSDETGIEIIAASDGLSMAL